MKNSVISSGTATSAITRSRTTSSWRATCRPLGLDAEALHRQLELPARIQQHSQEQFQHKAEARFLAKKEQLDSVVYSLLRVRDGFLARELYLRIAGQEANFADLAAEHSQGRKPKRKASWAPSP